MTYAEAIQFLYDLRMFGAKFGLENSFKLAGLAGNPQAELRFIHVAGTNGKGSTCAMLESIYRAAGLRVGLFTSPHLVSFRERIQVNRELISENDVVRLLGSLQPLLQQFPAGHHPTFFETVTIMALKYFAEMKCDLVIWETGLGGRLDSTNIVTPLASVITNIALDHQQWLGQTLEKIAFEKAGIIKPGIPVITAAGEPEALAAIETVARERRAPLTRVPTPGTKMAATPAPRLPGEHQRQNAALAVAVIQTLQSSIPVTEMSVQAGLQTVDWPGRMQLVTGPGGQKILLDGAHNPAGAQVLRNALQEEFPDRPPALIFGVFRDKDSASMCRTLAPMAGRILLVSIHSDRTEDPLALAPACRESNPDAPVSVCPSLAEALRQTQEEPFVLIAGSLYLIGEALELLEIASESAKDEKALNEWKR